MKAEGDSEQARLDPACASKRDGVLGTSSFSTTLNESSSSNSDNADESESCPKAELLREVSELSESNNNSGSEGAEVEGVADPLVLLFFLRATAAGKVVENARFLFPLIDLFKLVVCNSCS